MKISPLPQNEKERLEVLKSYEILDTKPEEDFNEIVELASQICNTPIALITLLDETRQWFKAKTGIGITETHRDISFCAHTLHENDIMLVPDTSKDERFFDNPLVTQDPKIRFYAGMPLITNTGFKLGSLCVIDHKIKNLNREQLNGLRILGKQVIKLLDLRIMTLEQSRLINNKNIQLDEVFGRINEGFIMLDENWRYTYANKHMGEIVHRDPHSLIGKNVWEEFPDAVGSATYQAFHKAMAEQCYICHIDHYEPLNLWHENRIYPSQNGISVFIRDISEQKKGEAIIKESELKRTLIMDSALDAIICMDTDGAITFWNPQAEKIFGWQEIEILGRHLVDTIIPEQYRSRHLNGLKHYKDTGEGAVLNTVIEISALNRDGREFPIELAIVPIKQNDNEFFCAFIRDITDRKRNEDALRETEERYRSIFENSIDGIYQSTPDGRFITANQSMASIFGYTSPKELVNSVNDIGTQLYADAEVRTQMKGLLEKDGNAVGFELRAVKKDGDIIWIQANIRAAFDSKNSVSYFEGTVKDITKQKNQEAEIIREKELAVSFVNSLPGVFYMYDHSGKFLRWNKNFETITGYSADEIARMHPSEFFAEGKERDFVVDKIGEVFTKGFAEVEANFLLKDNTKIPYYFNGWKIEYENKPGLIGVGINISDRKKVEESLINSENKLRAFFRSTPDACVLMGFNFEILAYNSAGFELTEATYGKGLKEGDIFIDLIFPEVRPVIVEFLTKALKGESNQAEFPIPNIKLGRSVWWMCSFIPAYDKDGNIFGAVASSTNINEIKRTELKFKKQFEELQKTNHELDRFVYSVSHDLRAPLASILGVINIAEMEAPSPSFKNYLVMIRSSIKRLDGFIKEILDYSQNARKEVVAELINFQHLISESRSDLKEMGGAERTQVFVKANDSIPFYSDRTRIVILMDNLLSNSIKYQDYNKDSSIVSIQIDTSIKDIRIKFSDNGIGIAPEHLPKIFDMFYRASENSKGSGLGLYIASETLSKLGGTIKVESELGLSTTFEITIPNSPSNK